MQLKSRAVTPNDTGGPIDIPRVDGGLRLASYKLVGAAFLISLIGSLPLGNVNMIEMQISIARGYSTAARFAFGGLVAEVIYVCICVSLVNRLVRVGIFQKVFQWISLLLPFAFALVAFMTVDDESASGLVLVPDQLPPVIAGFLLVAINPLPMTFWLGWTTVLVEKGILQKGHNALYVTGIAVGSAAGSALFISVGPLLSNWLHLTHEALNYSIGTILVIVGIWQLTTFLRTSHSQKSVVRGASTDRRFF